MHFVRNVSPAPLARAGTPTDSRGNDFIGERIFDDAVLVDAGFVSESVGADDGFVRGDLRSGDFGEHAARGEQLLHFDVGGDAEAFFSDGEGDGDFFKGGVAGAFADAVDGAFNLADAGADCGKRVGDGHAEVVVAMGAESDALLVSEAFAHAPEHGAVFFGDGVADGVGEIEDGSAGFYGYFANFTEKVEVGAAGVFGGEFDFGDAVAAELDHRADGVQALLTGHVQLDLRCRSLVARKMWRRGWAADWRASTAALTSSLRARARAAMGTVRISWAT